MSSMTPASSGGAEKERLPLIFFGIVLVEVLSIVALYWLGRHFSV